VGGAVSIEPNSRGYVERGERVETNLKVFIAIVGLSTAILTYVIRDQWQSRRRAATIWYLLEVAVGIFFMLGMLYACTVQIIVRYCMSDLIVVPWTEEFARLMLVWCTFWGVTIVHRMDSQVSMTVFFDLAPPLLKRLLLVFGDLLVLAVLSVLTWYGWSTAIQQTDSTSITLGLPIAVYSFSIPISGVIMIVHTFRLLSEHVQGREKDQHISSAEI